MDYRRHGIVAAALMGAFGLPPSPALAEARPATRNQRCGPIHALGEGIGGAFLDVYRTMVAVGTTVVPHVGYANADDASALAITWPLQWAFGHPTGEKVWRRRCGPDHVERFHGHRVLVEPQIHGYLSPLADGSSVAFGVRPGYRFVYHGSDQRLGFGGGLGSTIMYDGGPVRASVGVEALGQFGACCSPGFLDLALRYDRFPERSENVVSMLVGWSYF